jgi:integration host factor subunit alpha
MALKKIDIIETIYAELDISKRECAQIVESLIDIIKERLARGEAVMITGFGKWSVKKKRARRGRNPQTGEKIMIDGRRVVKFTSSKKLRVKGRWPAGPSGQYSTTSRADHSSCLAGDQPDVTGQRGIQQQDAGDH